MKEGICFDYKKSIPSHTHTDTLLVVAATNVIILVEARFYDIDKCEPYTTKKNDAAQSDTNYDVPAGVCEQRFNIFIVSVDTFQSYVVLMVANRLQDLWWTPINNNNDDNGWQLFMGPKVMRLFQV